MWYSQAKTLVPILQRACANNPANTIIQDTCFVTSGLLHVSVQLDAIGDLEAV